MPKTVLRTKDIQFGYVIGLIIMIRSQRTFVVEPRNGFMTFVDNHDKRLMNESSHDYNSPIEEEKLFYFF